MEPVFVPVPTATLPVIVVVPVEELLSGPLTFSAAKFEAAVPLMVLVAPLSVTAFAPAVNVPALKMNVPFVVKDLFNVSIEAPAFVKF